MLLHVEAADWPSKGLTDNLTAVQVIKECHNTTVSLVYKVFFLAEQMLVEMQHE